VQITHLAVLGHIHLREFGGSGCHGGIVASYELLSVGGLVSTTNIDLRVSTYESL
jgi:hypothetical protein